MGLAGGHAGLSMSRGGRTFAGSATYMELAPPKYQKYRQTGFATPSGKVELASSVLADLGFDPLPYYRELPVQPDEFPYLVYRGWKTHSSRRVSEILNPCVVACLRPMCFYTQRMRKKRVLWTEIGRSFLRLKARCSRKSPCTTR